MKKTLKSCKRFIFLHYIIWLIVPIPFICIVALVDTQSSSFTFGIIFLLISVILSFSFILAAIISMRLYRYEVDGHEVICFDAYHAYMIVDEQVVDKAWSSIFIHLCYLISWAINN